VNKKNLELRHYELLAYVYLQFLCISAVKRKIWSKIYIENICAIKVRCWKEYFLKGYCCGFQQS